MNLVVDCMQVVSSRPLDHFLKRQPEYLLRHFQRCLKRKMSPVYKRTLRKVYEYVEDRNEALGLWKDSELYNPIEYMTAARDEEYFPYLMELLQVLLGLKDIRKAKRLPDGYYRLRRLTGRIYEIEKGRLRALPERTVWNVPGFKIDVYLPRRGMFTDLLGEKLYPEMPMRSLSPVKKLVADALSLMRKFSRDVWDDFQEAIFNIVLLTDPPGHAVDSLTMTSKYYGGIFFNGFRGDSYKGVESLVHEYIHNRCSLWWELVPPTGIPGDDKFIVSPVTGNKVLASTMIHAFIIYVSALQFYRHVQRTELPSDAVVRRRLNARASHIASNIPALHRRLNRLVGKGTDMKKLFEYLMEVYEPLKKEP